MFAFVADMFCLPPVGPPDVCGVHHVARPQLSPSRDGVFLRSAERDVAPTCGGISERGTPLLCGTILTPKIVYESEGQCECIVASLAGERELASDLLGTR